MAKAGPVSVAYEVVSDFRHYSSGVYQSNECKQGKHLPDSEGKVGFGAFVR